VRKRLCSWIVIICPEHLIWQRELLYSLCRWVTCWYKDRPVYLAPAFPYLTQTHTQKSHHISGVCKSMQQELHFRKVFSSFYSQVLFFCAVSDNCLKQWPLWVRQYNRPSSYLQYFAAHFQFPACSNALTVLLLWRLKPCPLSSLQSAPLIREIRICQVPPPLVQFSQQFVHSHLLLLTSHVLLCQTSLHHSIAFKVHWLVFRQQRDEFQHSVP
jgi:hypothetical protein